MMKHAMFVGAAALWLGLGLGLAGCAEEDEKDGGDAGGLTWETGNFVITANSVDDGCLEGAANVVAIPNPDGIDNPTRRFNAPLTFPGSAEAGPLSSTLSLVDPFTPTDATFVKGADGGWSWTPEPTNAGVDLGQLNDAWAGCTADFAFGSSWVAEEAASGGVRFVGHVHFRVTGTNDADTCPIPEDKTLPCSVSLGATATPE